MFMLCLSGSQENAATAPKPNSTFTATGGASVFLFIMCIYVVVCFLQRKQIPKGGRKRCNRLSKTGRWSAWLSRYQYSGMVEAV